MDERNNSSLDPQRVQDVIAALQAQRDQALNAVINLQAEVASLMRKLDTTTTTNTD